MGNEGASATTQELYADWLKNLRSTLQTDSKVFLKREIGWSWCRLAMFAAGVAIAVILRHSTAALIVAILVSLAIFLYAVLRHCHWQNRRKTAELELIIVKESLHQSVDEGTPVRDRQRPYAPPSGQPALPEIIPAGPIWPLTEQEQDDLDLYGKPIGLFGLLNRCCTPQGARRLSDMLHRPLLSPETLTERQQAVRWLAAHAQERIAMMASAVPLREYSRHLDSFIQLLQRPLPTPGTKLSQCIRLWSVLTGLISAYALAQVVLFDFAWVKILFLVMVVNGIVWHVFKSRLLALLEPVSPLKPLTSTCQSFLGHARCVHQQLGKTTHLGIIKRHLSLVVTQAQIPSLCEWVEWGKLGGVVRQPLNLTVFYDIHIAEAVVKRLHAHGEKLLSGLAALSELEALNSLACFATEQTQTSYPTLCSDKQISIKDGHHPLLLESTPNSLQLNQSERIWVITGPNAGGKSTFLRMVGVNVLLAQIGSAVCAQSMTWSPVRLMTNMRVRDDLAKHESYFLSEVRRLYRLVLDRDQTSPIFGLIDEPFHGTNFQEQSAASIALLEHFIASGHFYLIATHQDVLTRRVIDEPSTANQHFAEHLADKKILFNYQLHPGPATSKTAIRILAQEGFPDTLIKRARSLMEPEE
ncbi:hypothetical protein ACFL6U_25260 [Planctomycetota bacterium]